MSSIKNKGQFEKGFTPWNKGKKNTQPPNSGSFQRGVRKSVTTEFKKSQVPWNKGIKYIQISGENHHNWKGGVSKVKGYATFNARRRRVRKKANGGSHTLVEWQTLKAQYNWTCPCCRRKEPEIKLTEDHIISLHRGGSDNIENIQPLCFLCNTKKRTRVIKYEYVIN